MWLDSHEGCRACVGNPVQAPGRAPKSSGPGLWRLLGAFLREVYPRLRACGLGPLAHAELFLEHILGACGSQRAGMSFTGCTPVPRVLVVSPWGGRGPGIWVSGHTSARAQWRFQDSGCSSPCHGPDLEPALGEGFQSLCGPCSGTLGWPHVWKPSYPPIRQGSVDFPGKGQIVSILGFAGLHFFVRL